MMMTKFLVFLVFLPLIIDARSRGRGRRPPAKNTTPPNNGRVQIPITGEFRERFDDLEFFDVEFELEVGTPPQKQTFLLVDRIESPDLYVLDSRAYPGNFDPTKSTSFVKTGSSVVRELMRKPKENGVNGTDIVAVNGQKLGQHPFRVLNYRFGKKQGYLGFTRHTNRTCPAESCTSFTESILKGKKDQVLLLAWDKAVPNQQNQTTGQLIFGDMAKDLCQENKWTYTPEIQAKEFNTAEQWMIHVEKVSAGKYSSSGPSIDAKINYDAKHLLLTEETYDGVVAQLGNKIPFEYGFFPYIDCSTKTPVVLEVGSGKLEFGPEVYLDQNDKNGEGKCRVAIYRDHMNIEIPLSWFKNKCLAYDFKNLRIGFTERV